MVTKKKAGSRKAVTVKRKTTRKTAPAADEPLFDPRQHVLVPKHEKLSDKDAKELFERYHTTLKEMPKISSQDPALTGMAVKQGDIIRITRKSYTAGETVFYRGVVDE